MFFPQAIILVIIILIKSSCTTSLHNTMGVKKAMNRYDHLILTLDADSISMLFTPDGNLGEIARGRDSIKKFLSSFKNIKVLSQVSTTESIKISGNVATQKGSYHQTDLVSKKDTVNVKGDYIATWQWLNKGWYIKQMTTKSTN